MKSDNLKLLIHAGNPIISMETPDEPGPSTWSIKWPRRCGCRCWNGRSPRAWCNARRRRAKVLVEPGKIPLALRSVKETSLSRPLPVQGPRRLTARTRRSSATSATCTSRPTRGCGR